MVRGKKIEKLKKDGSGRLGYRSHSHSGIKTTFNTKNMFKVDCARVLY